MKAMSLPRPRLARPSPSKVLVSLSWLVVSVALRVLFIVAAIYLGAWLIREITLVA
jgi:hypothetical protein